MNKMDNEFASKLIEEIKTTKKVNPTNPISEQINWRFTKYKESSKSLVAALWETKYKENKPSPQSKITQIKKPTSLLRYFSMERSAKNL